MLLLALDTATLTASVAVVRLDGGAPTLLAAADVETGTHSERLMPLVVATLAEAGVGAADLDGLAVGAGPGSFTGLRIGLATAKGLAYATGRPLWLASSLAALAWELGRVTPPGRLLVPALDARRGEVYVGFYRAEPDGVPRAVAAETVVAPGRLAAAVLELDPDGGEVAGDALTVHAAALALPPTLHARAEVRATPPALGVAAVAAGGDRTDALARGAPQYIRRSEAEIMYPDGVPGARRRTRGPDS